MRKNKQALKLLVKYYWKEFKDAIPYILTVFVGIAVLGVVIYFTEYMIRKGHGDWLTFMFLFSCGMFLLGRAIYDKFTEIKKKL